MAVASRLGHQAGPRRRGDRRRRPELDIDQGEVAPARLREHAMSRCAAVSRRASPSWRAPRRRRGAGPGRSASRTTSRSRPPRRTARGRSTSRRSSIASAAASSTTATSPTRRPAAPTAGRPRSRSRSCWRQATPAGSPHNQAVAINDQCTNCVVYAGARQFVRVVEGDAVHRRGPLDARRRAPGTARARGRGPDVAALQVAVEAQEARVAARADRRGRHDGRRARMIRDATTKADDS